MTERVQSGKIISGSLLETTRRWGFSVRSLLAALSGRLLTVEIGRTTFEETDTWRASCDRSVRSPRVVPSEGVQQLYFMGASI